MFWLVSAHKAALRGCEQVFALLPVVVVDCWLLFWGLCTILTPLTAPGIAEQFFLVLWIYIWNLSGGCHDPMALACFMPANSASCQWHNGLPTVSPFPEPRSLSEESSNLWALGRQFRICSWHWVYRILWGSFFKGFCSGVLWKQCCLLLPFFFFCLCIFFFNLMF